MTAKTPLASNRPRGYLWIRVFALISLLLAAPVTYELDPNKTELLALTQPGGLPGAAHPHVILATGVTGKIVWDAEAPEASSISISFPTQGLRPDDPLLRKREGMKEVSDESRKAVLNNLREEDQLSPALFPTISFQSTGIKPLGEGKLEVKGRLSVRNVEKEISLPVTIAVKDGEFSGQGTVTIKHSDFRFKPFSAALGAVKNLDEIVLKLKVVARSTAPP